MKWLVGIALLVIVVVSIMGGGSEPAATVTESQRVAVVPPPDPELDAIVPPETREWITGKEYEYIMKDVLHLDKAAVITFCMESGHPVSGLYAWCKVQNGLRTYTINRINGVLGYE